SEVKDSKDQSQGEVAEKTKETPATEGIQPKPVTELAAQEAGPPPPGLGAAAAAPKPKSEAEISMKEGSQELDQQMAEGDVTEARRRRQQAAEPLRRHQEEGRSAPGRTRYGGQCSLRRRRAAGAGSLYHLCGQQDARLERRALFRPRQQPALGERQTVRPAR